MPRFILTAADAPAKPGAYVLLLRLDAPIVARAGGREAVLAAGRYLYCGSAKGPGGLAARLSRHMREGKRPHWHIDQLTMTGTIEGAWIFPGGDECALNVRLNRLPIPLDGFGSSDCPRCRAHLRAFPDGAALPSRWEHARKDAHSRPENVDRPRQNEI